MTQLKESMWPQQKIDQDWYDMWRRCYGCWSLGLLVNNELLTHYAASSNNTTVFDFHPPPLVIIEDTERT